MQVPLTFSGIGTREVAFSAIFANYFATETAIAVALLGNVRVVLPPVITLIFLRRYLRELLESIKLSKPL